MTPDRPNADDRRIERKQYPRELWEPETVDWTKQLAEAAGDVEEFIRTPGIKRVPTDEIAERHALRDALVVRIANERGLSRGIAEGTVGEAVHVGLLEETEDQRFVYIPTRP